MEKVGRLVEGNAEQLKMTSKIYKVRRYGNYGVYDSWQELRDQYFLN